MLAVTLILIPVPADQIVVRFLVLISLAAAVATAQSPPPAAEAQPSPDVFKFEVTHLEATKPRYIRIFNLDEGTRLILLPPPRSSASGFAQSSEDSFALIFNGSEEGIREIVLTPTR